MKGTPSVLKRLAGTSNSMVSADRRQRRPSTIVASRKESARYADADETYAS